MVGPRIGIPRVGIPHTIKIDLGFLEHSHIIHYLHWDYFLAYVRRPIRFVITSFQTVEGAGH